MNLEKLKAALNSICQKLEKHNIDPEKLEQIIHIAAHLHHLYLIFGSH